MYKVVLFATIMTYSIVVSQSFMYMLFLKNTQMALDGKTYTDVRQLIDANMMGTFKYVMSAALLLSLLLAVMNIKSPLSVRFITALATSIALLVDAILTLKGSVPINEIINSWAPAAFPDNWKEIRIQWFTVF